MITHHLLKTSARGDLYWQITLDGNVSYIEYGATGENGREEPPIQHSTWDEAKQFMNRQVQQKKRQGYRQGRHQALKRVSEFEEDQADEPHRKFNRPLPQHYDGEFDYEDKPVSSSMLQKKIKRLERKRNRTMQEDLTLANARADLQVSIKRFGAPMSEDEDGDTDSVASSASSYSKPPRGRISGVSPLNRRKSLRLALKKNTTVQMLKDTRQNSVKMSTPPHLKRLNTKQRWGNWRPKRQATSTQLNAAESNMNVDMESPRVIVRKPALLKRGSTTAGLREVLQGTKINEEIIVPKVFDNDSDASSSQPDTSRLASSNRRSMRRLGTKTVQIMPSVLEGVSPEEPSTSNPFMPAMQGAACETMPRMRRSTSRPRLLKRSSTAEAREEGPSNKRTKRATLQRCQSISAVTRQITLPDRSIWPVRIPAQVVWRVPLAVDGLVSEGRAVCVQINGCLVGDASGKVIVIDDKVSIKHVFQLSAGIKEIIRDGQFVYAICTNDHVYDISHADPRLVFDLKDRVKDCCLDIHDGVIVLCDNKGHVSRYDHTGQIVWKTVPSVGKGYVVCISDDGILCCSSVGVICLSFRDGTLLWETPLRDNAVHAVKRQESLYVACGPHVMRLDTSTGDVTRTYRLPKKGKTVTGNVTHVTVGGGLVFACGPNIVCYTEDTGNIVYIFEPPVMPCRNVQYFEGRLFYVGDSSMSVIDFSPEAISHSLKGENLKPVDIGPKIQSPVILPLYRLPTISVTVADMTSGVELECIPPEPRKSRLKVRATSKGYSSELDVQFPVGSSCLPGTKFIVNDLKRSDTGGFYRVLGDIKQVDS